MTIRVTARGTKGFLQYVQRAFPRTYVGMVREMKTSASLSGFGLVAPDVTTTAPEAPMQSTIGRTLQEIATVAAQAYLTHEQVQAQQSILQVQLQRAQQGLAPLDIDPARYGVPSPSVGIGLTGDTTRTLFLIGGGIGALWLLSMMFGHRRARA